MRVEGIKGSDFSSMKSVVETVQAPQKSEEAINTISSEKNDFMIKDEEKGNEDFKNLIQDLKKLSIEIKNTRFEFDIHEATKRVIVRVIDKTTDKVVSEIPPEKFLDLIADIWKQVGLIVDKKV
ncbi:flagellar protein FlaG [Thermovenabulum sp.]|uniref:flagellar protein FlaG n=1 Tax=Thermovenabulum sp. TaxID=3100335 RepID=UPI003C7DB80B